MGILKAGLLRFAALTLVVGAAVAAPLTAKAGLTDGLSLRVGGFLPQTDGLRNYTGNGAWGVGLDYKVGFIPKVLNGDHWSTSISVDFHYSSHAAGIMRSVPVSINQVYTFDSANGRTPYAGFCVTANTFGATPSATQPTVTRIGGGLIVGLNLSSKLYLEGRYEFVDKHNTAFNPEGFRGYLGWRF